MYHGNLQVRANSIEGGTNERGHDDNRGDQALGSPSVPMSYHFAVWEGAAPLSNAHGFSDYERLQAARVSGAATPGISALVEKLEAADHGAPDGTLWAVPLAECVSGPLLYFGAADGREDEAMALVERTAAELSLVAFDPQTGTLLPSATAVARAAQFQLPPASEFALHLEAVIDEAINAETAMAGIVEHLETTYYVQWMTRDGTLLIEAQGDTGLDQVHHLGVEAKVALAGLGFVEADPNWSVSWVDGLANIDKAAQLLARVMAEVRAVPSGTLMELQTFPV